MTVRLLAHQMRRGAVAIAVELQAKILMHQGLDRVAIIGNQGRQRSQTIRAKALAGSLPGFAMQALVGDLVQPFPHLAIDVGEVGKLAERPEVLAEIADAPALDLAFFPARGRVAGAREKATFAGEGQEPRIKSNQSADVLGNDGQEIVIPAFAGNSAQSLKSMEVATDESLEALTMGELDVEHPAVSLDQTEGTKVALVASVVQGSEMAPVDLEALRGAGFHAHEGAGRMCGAPQLADVISQNGDSTLVPERSQALQDDHGAGGRVLLQQVGDGRLERINLAGSLTVSGSLHRRLDVPPQSFSRQVQMASDLARRPMLAVEQAVNFVNAVGIQHGSVVRQWSG